MTIYEIWYNNKCLERLTTKSVAEKILAMYQKGQVWTHKKPIQAYIVTKTVK